MRTDLDVPDAAAAPADAQALGGPAAGAADDDTADVRRVGEPRPVREPQPLLSVCMIVRDSARTLAACLAGVRPWADELVVVDTGSVDDTPAIAAGFGARVFHFPWCDDFAAARNESLRHAHGRWVFWLDADDTIDADNGRRLRALAAQPAPDGLLAHVVQVRCPASDAPGADVTAVDHLKLVRNRPDLRFEGRIHEQLLPAVRRAGGDVGWTDLFVTHSGADRTPAGRRRKHERDLRLLRLDLLDRPGHSFVLFNLGMTLADAGDHAAAAEALAAAVAAGVAGESHLRKAHALLAASLGELGRLDDALAACRRGLAAHPDDTELNFRAGLASHRVGRLDEAADFYRRAMTPPADRAFASVDRGLGSYKALYNLAAVFLDQGRPADATAAYREVVRLAPDWEPGRRELHRRLRDRVDQVVASENLAGGNCTAEPAEDAVRRLERAVDADPRDAVTHADLAVALRRAGRDDEAVAAYDVALMLYRARPAGWRVAHPREAAELALLLEARCDGRGPRNPGHGGGRWPGWHGQTSCLPVSPLPDVSARAVEDTGKHEVCPCHPISVGGGPTGSPAPRFTVLVGCYGGFPDYSVRCLDAVAAGRELARHCDVLVGLNACGRATVARARALADAGVVQGMVESRANRNKDPMMRLLVEMAAAPYVLWLDDDSHFVSPDWPARVAAFLAAEHPFDVAGVAARWGPRRLDDPAYAAFAAARPWWRTAAGYPPTLREWVPFVPGGLFLARAAFLREHDFPDRGMTKALDDVALGELVQQVGGRLAYLPPDLQAVARVSDGRRRGENFLLTPGGAY
jgi:tetratricopeptide (TPR) repeat protein